MMTLSKPIFVMNGKLDLKASFNNNNTHTHTQHFMAIHPGKIHKGAPGKPGLACFLHNNNEIISTEFETEGGVQF